MDPAVELLFKLVSIPSPTGSTSRAVEFLHGWCVENGMDVVIDRGALVINPGARDLLLLGHIDTVPGEVPVKLEEVVLWGRGSVDAKGPLSAAVSALKDLPSLWDRVMLVAVPYEEGGSETAKRLRNELPEMPCIILEPGNWDGITISYRGRVLFDIEVNAPRAHSGSNEPFAPEVAIELFKKLSESWRPRVLKIEGDQLKTVMRLDIRYPENEVLVLHDIPGVTYHSVENTPPYSSDKRSPLVRSFLGAIRSQGGKPAFKKKTGTSDMNILGERWKTPIIAYGPGNSSLDHTDEERIELSEYLRSIVVLKTVIAGALGCPFSQ
jgi:LysW-gamma-L-lysine carboxypeptidase